MGALGNQMFQYAALRGIASKTNQNWKIPSPGVTLYYDLLKYFEMKSVTENNFITNETYPNVKAKSFKFDADLFKVKNCNLDDYFQSEKYFLHIKDEILKDFTFKQEFVKPITEKYIFIHVRRTDYVKLPKHHPACSLEYYEKALEYYPKDILVKVFSDDLEWCKNNFKGDRFIIKDDNDYYPEQLFLKGPREYTWYPTPYDDFYEMVNAVGGIIANSSFSWWGAYLIRNKQYPIVAPRKWFGPAINNDISDLIPSEWNLI